MPSPRSNMSVLIALSALTFSSALATAQTSTTGLLTGRVTDATGAVVASADVSVVNERTGISRLVRSDAHGMYIVPLLSAAVYAVTVRAPGFADAVYTHVPVDVYGTQSLPVRLVAGVQQQVEVRGNTEISTPPNLGSVTDRQLVETLPLASRNYTQILGLNTGIAANVADASALGRGPTSYAAGPGGFSSNGASTNDNNFQMDGIDVNDLQGSGYLSRGVPVPSPDAIEEFRVSTQPYDASQGRNAGANVNVITRTGGSSLHGSAFEYFRNDVLNANSYFRKLTQQSRPVLKQNLFGGSVGGPVVRQRVFGFASYQGTKQANGLDSSCSSSVSLPPLTDDRSAAGIGAVFQGQRGYFQNAFGGVGPAILANGSNVNPVALAILQRKNADGSYLIPTPQKIVSTTGDIDARGFSAFSQPCHYSEQQGVANADWQASERHHLALHSFVANSNTTQTLPSPLLGGATLPSSPFLITDRFRTVSLAHTWIVREHLLNDLRFGINRLRASTVQTRPFSYSSVGATVPAFDDASPLITIGGASIGGNGGNLTGALNTFTVQDVATYTRGRQFVHLGGGIIRNQINQPVLSFYGAALFLRTADFILGQNAAQNGTAALCAFAGCGPGYSDVAFAQDTPGTVVRAYRAFSANVFLQDDVRLTPRFTVNIGLRYERLGDLVDRLGHNTSFYPSLANYNPPVTGTLQGYVIPANYQGPVPAGVTRLSNSYGVDGVGQNTWQPRFGMAWILPGSDALTLRAGYGVFRSRITADAYNQSVVAPPFARLRQFRGNNPASAALTLGAPLPAFTQALPQFAAYGPAGSSLPETPVFNGLAPNVQPPFFHRFNLDLESRLGRGFIFDLGYVGALGRHLLSQVFINQAGIATASAPIHGATSVTLANVAQRVPLPGFTVQNLSQFQTTGTNAYHSLQASLKKRAARLGELQLAYTWARDLTDTYNGTTGQHGGIILGDQTNRRAARGPDTFLREHRIVGTYLLNVPAPKQRLAHAVFGEWQIAGVTTAQSGHPLTITYQNQFSAYGILNDRPQRLPQCIAHQGSLNAWFNRDCYSKPPVIGADGVATTFGNAPVGEIRGPRQFNFDAALSRNVPLGDRFRLAVRAEGFNVANHAEFADPDVELSSPTFGQVRATVLNPRVVQLALRLLF